LDYIISGRQKGAKMEMGHLPFTAITSFHPTHGGTRRGRGMVVLDNPLGLESKKSQIKIKPPAMIIGL